MDVNIRKLRARADVCLSLKYRAESLLVEALTVPRWFLVITGSLLFASVRRNESGYEGQTLDFQSMLLTRETVSKTIPE
jgi:hypothetical protein